jgi:hypothetical protein
MFDLSKSANGKNKMGGDMGQKVDNYTTKQCVLKKLISREQKYLLLACLR